MFCFQEDTKYYFVLNIVNQFLVQKIFIYLDWYDFRYVYETSSGQCTINPCLNSQNDEFYQNYSFFSVHWSSYLYLNLTAKLEINYHFVSLAYYYFNMYSFYYTHRYSLVFITNTKESFIQMIYSIQINLFIHDHHQFNHSGWKNIIRTRCIFILSKFT